MDLLFLIFYVFNIFVFINYYNICFSFFLTVRRRPTRALGRRLARMRLDFGVTYRQPKKAKTAKIAGLCSRTARWSDFSRGPAIKARQGDIDNDEKSKTKTEPTTNTIKCVNYYNDEVVVIRVDT